MTGLLSSLQNHTTLPHVSTTSNLAARLAAPATAPVAAAPCLQAPFERREEVGRLRLLALLNQIMIRASKVSEGRVLRAEC